jgi:hypothetical protein
MNGMYFVRGVLSSGTAVNISVEGSESFASVKSRLEERLQAAETGCSISKMKRVDEDGNYITIDDDEDWILALSESDDSNVYVSLEM